MGYLKIFIIILLIGLSAQIYAQVYTDFVGAGHAEGVTVTASSSSTQTDANNSINGSGLGINEYAAARFLNNASLGADYETITSLADQGISDWLDVQLNLAPQVSFTDTAWMIWDYFLSEYIAV